MIRTVLLPLPDRPYAALKADLMRLGWVWASESQILPLVRGEPESVEYTHPAGGRLRYDFNPAVWLRELSIEAPAPQVVALAGLPQLGAAGIARLLESTSGEEVVRGLFAARALRCMALMPRIYRLCEHPDDLVRRAAADVARTLPPLAVREALETFQSLRTDHPERCALFAMMPVAGRRQVLRWLGRDRRSASTEVHSILRAALADDDTEVRATAALITARLGADGLLPTIAQLELPPELADAGHRAREALLSKQPIRTIEVIDDDTLLLQSLLEPLPVVPPPKALPRHLRFDDGALRLARSGLEVVLVPSVPHWIGSSRTPEHPLRRVTERAFAIAMVPLDARASQAIGIPTPYRGPLLMSAKQAESFVERLGELEGICMTVPSRTQWEMATRGPDGRRYAAGNLVPAPVVSPWGAMTFAEPEWTADRTVWTGSESIESLAAATAVHPVRFVMAFPC